MRSSGSPGSMRSPPSTTTWCSKTVCSFRCCRAGLCRYRRADFIRPLPAATRRLNQEYRGHQALAEQLGGLALAGKQRLLCRDDVEVGGRAAFVACRRHIEYPCLLYTSDAADDLLCVDLGGRRI